MKRRISNFFSRSPSASPSKAQVKRPDAASLTSQDTDDEEEDDVLDGGGRERKALGMRRRRTTDSSDNGDVMDGSGVGGPGSVPRPTSLRIKKESASSDQDTRLTKPIDDTILQDVHYRLYDAIKTDDISKLDAVLDRLSTMDIAINHKSLCQANGMHALHVALERRLENPTQGTAVVGLLIRRGDLGFLRQGYVNIPKQIPPSYRTSLHMLSVIGDCDLTDKLLNRLTSGAKKSAAASAADGEEKPNFMAQFNLKVKHQEVAESGLHDKVVFFLLNEPRRRVESLHLAAIHGHAALLELLVNKYECDVNTADSEQLTALAWAVKRGHLNCVQVLINKLKADVNKANGYDCAPLHWAIECDFTDAVQAIVGVAGEDGELLADVNKKRVKRPRSPLEMAAELGRQVITKILLKTNQIDLPTKHQALICAAANGHRRIIKKLLKNEPDLLDMADDDGNTALLVAAEFKHLETVQLLLQQGANLQKKNYERKTIFDLAMHYSDRSLLTFLVEYYRTGSKEEDNKLPSYYLHVAAAAGDVDKIRYIEELGIDYHTSLDDKGNTFIHTAVAHDCVNVLDLVEKTDDIINQQNNDGETALHIAAKRGCVESVERLIALRARLHISDREGQIALHSAVTAPVSSPAAAAQSVRVVQIILDSINKASSSRVVNEMDKCGCTPLHLAVKYKRADIVKALRDLDPEMTNMDGETPLHIAAKVGPPEVLQTLIDVFRGTRRRVNIDRRDQDGSSALHLSALVGDEEKVRILVKSGADMALLTETGASILHRLIDTSIKTPTLADDAVRIYRIMVESSAVWWSARKDKKLREDDPREFYFFQLEAVRYLTSEIFFKGMNVLQYASHRGTALMINEILQTVNVYRFTKRCPFTSRVAKDAKSDVIDVLIPSKSRDGDEGRNHKGLLMSAMFLENGILCDVTYLIPGNMPDEGNAPVEPKGMKREESNKSDGVWTPLETTLIATPSVAYKRNRSKSSVDTRTPEEIRKDTKRERKAEIKQTVSCLEFIVNNANEEFAVNVLDTEPFKVLVKRYWQLCRRAFEGLMWTHVTFMVLFTYFCIPTSKYLVERFNITNSSGVELEAGPELNNSYQFSFSVHGLFLIWPICILFYELIYIVAALFRLRKISTWKDLVNMNALKMTEVTSGLMMLPMGIILFSMNNLSHISALLFGSSQIAWYCMFVYASNPHSYLTSLAMTYIFGWLHTINFVKGFKDWNAFANILKHILVKDVTRFIYIYIFILISFGYAIHVLLLSDYIFDPEHLSSTDTIYLQFYRMLSPGNVLDVSEDEKYQRSGGSIPVLRGVCAAYTCLSSVVLVNLLIAMMNSTYSDVRLNKATAWRVESLRMALWVERNVPFIKRLKILQFKTTWDASQKRWYLTYVPEDYQEEDTDDNEGATLLTTKRAPLPGEVDEDDHDDEGTDGGPGIGLGHRSLTRIQSASMEEWMTGVRDKIDDLRRELEAKREEEAKTQRLVVELRNDVRRVQEACLECVQLAKLGQRTGLPTASGP